MKSTFQATILTLAATGLCFAQGRYGWGMGTAPASSLDMSAVRNVSGVVNAVAIGYGLQYPSVAIGKVQIKLAPVWYLLDNSFELKAGDSLSVQAAPSRSSSDPYLYAIEATNPTTDQRVLLRDALGAPLWSGAAPAGVVQVANACSRGSVVAVATGTIDQVNIGLGIQFPTLTLRIADGTLLTFKLGPERVLLKSDIEWKPGDTATVTYASCVSSDERIALTLMNANGKTVVLRDGSGRPGW